MSFLGDSLGLVALLLYVEAETGAALAVALLLLAGDFTPGLFGAFAGVVGDRIDLRKVMVGCDLAQGVLVVAMAVALPPLPVLLVLVAVRSLVAQVFQASSGVQYRRWWLIRILRRPTRRWGRDAWVGGGGAVGRGGVVPGA